MRPAAFPPSDGYLPPEDPLVGVARQIAITRRLKERHPNLIFVGSGYSYLQEWLPNVAQRVVREGGADFVGIGRMALAYPDLPADVLAGRPLARKMLCRTFSDCTTGPRNGMISGCFPLDPFYKARPGAGRGDRDNPSLGRRRGGRSTMRRRASCPTIALTAVMLMFSPIARAATPDWKGLLAKPDDWYRGPGGGPPSRTILSHESRRAATSPKNLDTTARPFAGDRGQDRGHLRQRRDRRRGPVPHEGRQGDRRPGLPRGGRPGDRPHPRRAVSERRLAAVFAAGQHGYHRHITFNGRDDGQPARTSSATSLARPTSRSSAPPSATDRRGPSTVASRASSPAR